jgi:hypothetical protein
MTPDKKKKGVRIVIVFLKKQKACYYLLDQNIV